MFKTEKVNRMTRVKKPLIGSFFYEYIKSILPNDKTQIIPKTNKYTSKKNWNWQKHLHYLMWKYKYKMQPT